MAYCGIDRKRFAYLLSLGTDEFELRKFFTDCRRLLILRGAKVQNLPHGQEARIRTLAAELPASTDDIVRDWFSKNVTMVDPEQAEAIVAVFRRYEEIEDELPEDDARRYARSCLVRLFDDAPPPAPLLEFLKSPIRGTTADEKVPPEVSEAEEPKLEVVPYPSELPQILVDLVEGRDVDPHLQALPVPLATFVSALQAASGGRIEEAREGLDGLAPESSLHGLLHGFLREREAQIRSPESTPRGLRIQDEQTFDGALEVESDEVLGYCTHADPPSAVFVHPIGIVRSGNIERLDREAGRVLFPETGDIIAFAGAHYPRQPHRGQIGVWRVAEHETDKPTRFHLTSETRPVYQGRLVPFRSTDYDSVREYLKDQVAQTSGRLLQPLLFQLEDGLVVGARSDGQDLSRDEGFESGLLAWTSLPAHRLEGRLLVLGPLPKEQRIYECAPLASAVRKLFRAPGGDSKRPGKLTRAQLRELREEFRSVETGLDAFRIQRIKDVLDRLDEQRDALEELVSVLMEHPDLKTRIDQLVEQQAEKERAEKGSLKDEIGRLERERNSWNERIRRQQVEHQKLRDETSAVVKAAFEKARTQGVATLAEVAVFQALCTPGAAERSDQALRGSSTVVAHPTVRHSISNGGDPIPTLLSLGIRKREAAAFAALGRVALEAGLIVRVRGVAARRAVEEWARTIGGTLTVVDSTVGLVDDRPVQRALDKDPQPAVIAVLDGNLSALDIYARPISDLVIARIAEPSRGSAPAVFLSLADGVGALPLPTAFERLSLEINLDEHYTFGEGSDSDALMSEVGNTDDGVLHTQLWRPAADSLLKRIEALGLEDRGLVLSILSGRSG